MENFSQIFSYKYYMRGFSFSYINREKFCKYFCWEGLTQKYCHAELVSASALDIVHRFRNEFGMTPDGKLIGQPQL
ncbi:MAG TPA: hypothetical protein DCM57_04865 [Treponema sp.]|nr:hypothetical protein [Treponema sp.]